jgi:hypothetical protein
MLASTFQPAGQEERDQVWIAAGTGVTPFSRLAGGLAGGLPPACGVLQLSLHKRLQCLHA